MITRTKTCASFRQEDFVVFPEVPPETEDLTPDQIADLCEYVEGLREASLRYDEIADKLEGKLPEEALEQLEIWHLDWKRRQLEEESKRPHESRCAHETGAPPGVQEWWVAGSPTGRRFAYCLVERLIGREALAQGVKIGWKPSCSRSLGERQTCDTVNGPGQAGGTMWMRSAVIFRTGEHIDHVEAEARIRRRVLPGSNRAKACGLNCKAVQLERLQVVDEKLDQMKIAVRFAALLQTYLGEASGIKSGAHFARLTGCTRQAVSARKLLIAEDYYKKTGGKAGFKGLTSAKRHREKVQSQSLN